MRTQNTLRHSRIVRGFQVSGSEYAVFLKWFAENRKNDLNFKHLRFGQAFHNYFKLHKMTPTVELDKLWESDRKDFVECFVDFTQ